MARASIKSSDLLLTRWDLLILAGAALAGAAFYLLAAAITYRLGFPLDDAWIHQTYARNLALKGEWAFQPGKLSAGSTSPLWTALLTPGFWLHLSPYFWTYLLGGLILFALAVLGEVTARRVLPTYRPRFPWIGLFLAVEWHLVWAAMSGMETLLHALTLTGVLAALMVGSRRYLALGLLTGLSVWVRPDGLTLIGPAVLTIFLVEKTNTERLRCLTRYFIGFGSLFVLYLLFNLWLSGTPMPNTFYAKQAEYAAWQAKPWTGRLGVLAVQLFTGPDAALLPGILGWVVVSVRRRAWATLAGMIWFAGYLWLYLSRLPLYQHGRYVMPAMPILFLWGLLALAEFQKSTLLRSYQWVAQSVWQASLALVGLGFWFLGARSYGQDVAFIESEMVVTARWVAENIPADALIAAHDIGALGYFDNHQLIDLAGLVSPEVIPFMRNETRLISFLNGRQADYLIAFPAFYPQLTRRAQPVFVTGSPFAPSLGGENMVVYRWGSP